MDAAWQLLRQGGLPVASPRDRDGAPPSATELAAAACRAVSERPTGRLAEALAAWVLAWSQHWPEAYRTAFGADGAAICAWSAAQFDDPNRYLRLRRVALASLAHVL